MINIKNAFKKSGLNKKIQVKTINVNIGNDGNGNRWTYDKKTLLTLFEGKAAIENNYYEKTEELYKSDWHAWSGTTKTCNQIRYKRHKRMHSRILQTCAA